LTGDEELFVAVVRVLAFEFFATWPFPQLSWPFLLEVRQQAEGPALPTQQAIEHELADEEELNRKFNGRAAARNAKTSAVATVILMAKRDTLNIPRKPELTCYPSALV
jgi:hypothetical protein